jgi:hypothetical protein
MGQSHPSTPAQRTQCAAQLLAHAGEYGVVTALSRQYGVSRPTLYAGATTCSRPCSRRLRLPDPLRHPLPPLSASS